MNRNGNEPRTALLIRCTEEEARAIREAAKLQRRTVSSFVLRAVMNRISIQKRVGAPVQRPTLNIGISTPESIPSGGGGSRT
jgi:hypothetical protein